MSDEFPMLPFSFVILYKIMYCERTSILTHSSDKINDWNAKENNLRAHTPFKSKKPKTIKASRTKPGTQGPFFQEGKSGGIIPTNKYGVAHLPQGQI